MFSLTKGQVADAIDKFVWSYKFADNTCYNFKILYYLLELRESMSQDMRKILNKPIIIIAVSIIEVIFYDLMCRLLSATNHFPDHISVDKRRAVKLKLESERILDKKSGRLRIRNYKMSEMLAFFKDFEILGASSERIYHHLGLANYLRNRIHITNYFGNFEADESEVFTDTRTKACLVLLERVLAAMYTLYPRPAVAGQYDNWLAQLT